MSEATEVAASVFEAESGYTPVVNVSGVDAPTATNSAEVNSSQFYTEADLAKVRAQEKSKLYPELQTLKEKLASLEKEREEDAARKAAEAEAEAARTKAEKESELDAKSLIDLRTKELQEQLERERQERLNTQALFEKERAFSELTQYRSSRLEQEREAIIPELVDLISGNTPEEVDASLDGLKERSARILESAQSAMQNARREMTGTRVTTPPAGPLETNSEQNSFSAADLASMSMEDYAKLRPKLMSESARGKSRGLFG